MITLYDFGKPRGYTAGSKTTKTKMLGTPPGYKAELLVVLCHLPLVKVAVIRPLEAHASDKYTNAHPQLYASLSIPH